MTPLSPTPDVIRTIKVSPPPEIAHSEGGSVRSIPPLDGTTTNQTLSLKAVPDEGFAFTGWQGTIKSIDNPLILSASEKVSVFASFKPLWPLFIEQVEGGRILTNPEQSEFIEGSIVSVLAIPDEGYRFDHWLGSLSENRSKGTLISKSAGALIINESKRISAVFLKHQLPEIVSDLSTKRVKADDDFVLDPVVTIPPSLTVTPIGEAPTITSNPTNKRPSSHLDIKTSDGQVTIEIVGESGDEAWDIERSTDLVSWEPVERVVLKIKNGFASAMMVREERNGKAAFFRARRANLQKN